MKLLSLHLLCFLSSLFLPIFSNPHSHCPSHCGSIPVPYPFGIGHNCSVRGFKLSCTNSHPFLSHLQVLGISNGQLRVNSTPFIASDCASRNRTLSTISVPNDTPFVISSSANHFVAVGCDTVAIVSDGNGHSTVGCVSVCSGKIGFCEAALPEGMRYLNLGVGNMFGYKNESGLGNCSYGFVAEKGGVEFREGEELGEFRERMRIAMRLDWEIGVDGDGGAMCLRCGENGYCLARRRGYLCYCLEGFDGNPYLNGSSGCQDIDECRDPANSPCVRGARCRNRIPGFKCKCPFGSTGDGTKHGSGCRKVFQIVESVLGASFAVGLMFACGLWFYFAMKHRALIKLKEQYFRNNGGLLLKQQVSTREGAADCARIFSSEELKIATNGYDSSRILGIGGYGTVYKGVLEDGTTVAIKKSKVIDQAQIDLFVNELVILTQINHRNVVKLLGCCLETEVPMLVYEFISNGTLYEHIHAGRGPFDRIPWTDRLRIAIETAEALAYLHSAASMPIFHRDVKSSNILLDDNYTAKISDFGISRLVPLDQTQVPTLVQGTFGYLDPEYFQTSQLTAKSDVYSFGVVLVELLTGQKPVSFERPKEDSNLAMYFLSSLKCKDLKDFIDGDVMREGSVEELTCVAELARKCLLLRGDKRPTMKELARELALVAGLGRNHEYEIEDDENRRLTVLDAQVSLPANLSVTVDLAR